MSLKSTPAWWNPEAAGSRFTTRASLAILTRRGGADRHAVGQDSGPTEEITLEALCGPPSSIEELGDGRVVDGSYGRGAAGWVPVVEWTLQAMLAGAAWDVIKRGARRMRDLTESLRDGEVRFLVSRGTAALLAIAQVLETTDESEVLDVEAVEEPSALAGAEPSEQNFVGIEPWLVSLINADRTTRYVVCVAPSGEIQGVMSLPMGDAEGLYHPIPPPDEVVRPADSDSSPFDEHPAPEFDPHEGEDLAYAPDPRDEFVLGAREIASGVRSVASGALGAARAVRRRRNP